MSESKYTPSPEEQMQMMQYLQSLETLRSTDPAAYNAALSQLGVAPPEGSNERGSKEQLDPLSGLLDNFKAKDGESVAEPKPIQLPGGLSQLGSKGVEENKFGIMITPTPGFVFKTRRSVDSQKVFVNVCTHEDVAQPGLKKRLNENGEEVEGMNIPMSMGPLRIESDKEGKPCSVYDMIVNPAVLEESQADPTGQYRDFICQLAIQTLENKYKDAVDSRYKLPKLKYMGKEVIQQYIQDRKRMPNIEEVASKKSTPKSENPAQRSRKQSESKKPVIRELELIHLQYRVVNVGTSSLSSSRPSSCCSKGEYVEPLEVPATEDKGVVVIVSLDLSRIPGETIDFKSFDIRLSPFLVVIRIPSYHETTLHLACAVLPSRTTCSIYRRHGTTRVVEMHIHLPFDLTAFDAVTDAGSKPWLLSRAMALQNQPDPYLEFIQPDGDTVDGAVDHTRHGDDDDDDNLPEDKFHLKLPKDVDQYTGVPLDSGEPSDHLPVEKEEFAEDKFHKADIGSTYLINQREEAIKNKWDKYEKEKEERKDDDNCEYVDVDDFKPGGKFGGPKKDVSNSLENSSTSISEASMGTTSVKSASSGLSAQLSSNLWSELL
jgi:hypothetical protein